MSLCLLGGHHCNKLCKKRNKCTLKVVVGYKYAHVYIDVPAGLNYEVRNAVIGGEGGGGGGGGGIGCYQGNTKHNSSIIMGNVPIPY